MRRAVLRAIPLIVLAGTILATPVVAAEPELEGMYLAKGVDADGGEYDGLVQIVRHGDSFILMTLIPDRSGETIQVKLASIGIGILNGGVLAVSDYSPETARVVSYRVEDGGRRLVGRWTSVDGDGMLCEETLTKLPETPTPSKDDRPEWHGPRRVMPDA